MQKKDLRVEVLQETTNSRLMCESQDMKTFHEKYFTKYYLVEEISIPNKKIKSGWFHF